MWSVGQRVGEYELVAHLRDGGMASLFLARRLGPAGFVRDVAIKFVHPWLAEDEQFRQMFLDEAMLSARIRHPNCVQVEGFGEVAGAYYLVMEFVHGCSLSQLQRMLIARGRRLSPAYAVRIAMNLAEGLHGAHETRDETGRLLEVVHRDVSPENVLLAYAGHVKLIDFGIAKAYGRRHRTADGLLKGKFRYMAPEQAQARPVDRRTDVYQLGIVLWEMLARRRLFDADNEVDLIEQVRAPRIVPPSALVDRIGPALDAAVMAALDPDPNRRPPDARAFARLLGKAVPSAHEVDAGALSALLVAVMREQRTEQKGTYPPDVYERLEKQLPTRPEAAQAGAVKLATLEHAGPAPQGDPPALSAAGREGAGEGTQPEVLGASRGPEVPAEVRQRRLVRMAREIGHSLHELTTSISRLTADPTRRRALGFMLLGAVGAAGLLALLTLALRPGARVSGPPTVSRVEVAPAPASAVQAAPPLPKEDPLVLTPVRTTAEEPRVPVAPPLPTASSAANKANAARSERLASPVPVDGTPLIPEPGF